MLAAGSSLAVTIMLVVPMTTVCVRAEAPSRAVDHSDHASTEAREVTYEEAHDLLTAFLKYKECTSSRLTWAACPAVHALGRAKKESTLGTSSIMPWTEERATSGVASSAGELRGGN